MKVGPALVLAVSAALAVALSACSNSLDRPLHFEVPVGHTGPLLLIDQPDAPKIVRKTAEHYRIVFPSSGFARFSDARVLQRWHSTEASYSDGTTISHIPASPGIAFHSGGCQTSDNRTYYYWFFVGEEPAASEFFNGKDSSQRQNEWLRQRNLK